MSGNLCTDVCSSLVQIGPRPFMTYIVQRVVGDKE